MRRHRLHERYLHRIREREAAAERLLQNREAWLCLCRVSRNGEDGMISVGHMSDGYEATPVEPTARRLQLPTDDKARKRLLLWDYMFKYFPDAWLAEVMVALVGNDQHNPGEPLHWARDKSIDQLNTAMRHQFDYGMGVKKDSDGCWHLAKAIWRLKAQLQLDIEAERAEKGGTLDHLRRIPGEERAP